MDIKLKPQYKDLSLKSLPDSLSYNKPPSINQKDAKYVALLKYNIFLGDKVENIETGGEMIVTGIDYRGADYYRIISVTGREFSSRITNVKKIE